MRLSTLAMVIGLAATAAACNPPPPDAGNYVERVTAGRAAKDQQFQHDATPVPEGRKASLLPLAYYPIDPDYNVPAVLRPISEGAIVLMPTSTGEQRRERRAGTLEFTLKGEPRTLSAFVEADASDMNHLFVPFRDLTSGEDTYDAGRYLELSRTPTGYYELDFNRAFNPYCYYSLAYECPLPPQENRLQVRIEAGEQIRKSEGTKPQEGERKEEGKR